MAERPQQFIGAGAVVSPRACYLLEDRLNLRAIRADAQGVDDELYQAVHAIHYGAILWTVSSTRSLSEPQGEEIAERRETGRPSTVRLGSVEVAARLHLSTRRVQQLAAAGEYGAELRNGRWSFNPDLVEQDERRSA